MWPGGNDMLQTSVFPHDRRSKRDFEVRVKLRRIKMVTESAFWSGEVGAKTSPRSNVGPSPFGKV